MKSFYTRSCRLKNSLEMRLMQGAKIAPLARVRYTRASPASMGVIAGIIINISIPPKRARRMDSHEKEDRDEHRHQEDL